MAAASPIRPSVSPPPSSTCHTPTTTTNTNTPSATPSPPSSQKRQIPTSAQSIPPSRLCEACTQPHDGNYGSGRFCSVHCARRVAASRKWEKQRIQRKRHAPSPTSPPSATDPTRKRRRPAPSATANTFHNALHQQAHHLHPPHPHSAYAPTAAAHLTSLIHTQPHAFARVPLLPPQHPVPHSQQQQQQQHPLASYVDYVSPSVRALNPFYMPSHQHHPSHYYSFHPHLYHSPPQLPPYSAALHHSYPYAQASSSAISVSPVAAVTTAAPTAAITVVPPPPPPTPDQISGAQVNVQGGFTLEKDRQVIVDALLCLGASPEQSRKHSPGPK